jgi:WS/DGAT/MGAT family acyltransferase
LTTNSKRAKGAFLNWRRLSGTDAVFLYGETESAPLHVLGAVVLESSERSAGKDFQSIRAQIVRRLPALPILRRKLTTVPLDLDHPIWTDDPAFELDAHLHRAALPAPGGERELAEFLTRIAEMPLRRDRPLWELHVVEGLPDRRLALVAKIHHAAADGVGSIKLLAGLMDADSSGHTLDEPPAEQAECEPAPSAVALFAGAALSLSVRPLKGARELWRSRAAGAQILSASTRSFAGLGAPRTRLNCRISGRRIVSMGSVSLEDVKLVKQAFAATVNHVVLAACAGALRGYLKVHGELPRQPWVAAVPMALGDRRADGFGNSLSLLFMSLPVHLDDPLDRLHAAREASRAAISAHEALGGQLGRWADLVSPAFLAGASRAYTSLGLADRHRPLLNVLISNIRGPSTPLYCAGSRVSSCHPFGPIYDGFALNLTVMSYDGAIGIGAIACREAVPDLGRIPRAFEDSVAELRTLAALETGSAGASGAWPA